MNYYIEKKKSNIATVKHTLIISPIFYVLDDIKHCLLLLNAGNVLDNQFLLLHFPVYFRYATLWLTWEFLETMDFSSLLHFGR